MFRTLAATLFAALSVSGGTQLLPSANAQPAEQCVHLAGAQIGQLPLAVSLGGVNVRFLGWKATDIEAQTLVGFDVEASAPVEWKVSAGDRTFSGSSPSWIHPAGVVGPHVAAISDLVLCAR